jgi:hypothetical protein
MVHPFQFNIMMYAQLHRPKQLYIVKSNSVLSFHFQQMMKLRPTLH